MNELPNVHGLVPADQRERLCQALADCDQPALFAAFAGSDRARLTEIDARIERHLPILRRALDESQLCLRLSTFMPARHGGLFSGGMVERVPVFSRLGMSMHQFVQRYAGRAPAGQGSGRISRMSTADFREMDQCCHELNRSSFHDVPDPTRTVGSVCVRVFHVACDLAYRVIEWDHTLVR
ncbi:MAG: hypothetical protein IPM29_23870 [Planctomycetes bacterium]|nr:hypothetical protein [Planctomycetota bacterium]